MNRYSWICLSVLITLLLSIAPAARSSARADDTRYFPATGHAVGGLFLQYWDQHGGLAQQGYPISGELAEKSATDGKTYTVQYFERAVFELHPEYPAPNNVLLSLLGRLAYRARYIDSEPRQQPSTDNPRKFNQTGKTIGGAFRRYWEEHGGLAQQGYPISDEFQERSATNGKTYTVQYFERAVFELHPENAGTPNEVQLSLLGVSFFKARYGGTGQPTPQPQPTATSTPVGATAPLLFLKSNGSGQLALIDTAGNIFPGAPVNLPAREYSALESLGGGYIFAYSSNGVGVIGQVDEAGIYHNLSTQALRAGWPHITSFQNALVFYTPAGTGPGLGLLDVVRLRVPVDGSFIGERESPFGNLARLVAATSGGLLVGYSDKNDQGLVNVVRIAADGTWTAHSSGSSVPANFTNITRLYNDDILLYNRNDGSTYIGRVGADDSFSQVFASKTAQGWSAMSSGLNDIVVFYQRNGAMYTQRPGYRDSRWSILNAYGQPGPLGAGWEFVVSLR